MLVSLMLLGLGLAGEPALEPMVVPSGTAAVETQAVELNRATLSQLRRLPGIGEKRARDIIAHRLRRPFRRPADLMRVRGIGRRLYIRLKPWVRVERLGSELEKGG